MKISSLSILISITCFILIMVVNYEIATAYKAASGKTLALFSIKELLKYGYQYFYGLLGLIALILSIIARKKQEKKNVVLLAMILGILSVVIPFLKIWKLFI